MGLTKLLYTKIDQNKTALKAIFSVAFKKPNRFGRPEDCSKLNRSTTCTYNDVKRDCLHFHRCSERVIGPNASVTNMSRNGLNTLAQY